MNAERRSYRRFPYAVGRLLGFPTGGFIFLEKLKKMLDYKLNLEYH